MSRYQAKQDASKIHELIRNYLNNPDMRRNIIADRDPVFNEIRAFNILIDSPGPISTDNFVETILLSHTGLSEAIKRLNEILENQCQNLGEFRRNNILIKIPRNKGGLHIGYHFACYSLSDNKEIEFDDLVNILGLIDHTQNKSKDLTEDNIVKELRFRLKQQAIDHLTEKLHGNSLTDYRDLKLEMGLLEDSKNHLSTVMPEYHNRTWEDFDSKELESPKYIYILSTETGCGKTTFLRHLQLRILENTTLIPLFLEASYFDNMNINKWDYMSFLSDIINFFEEDKVKQIALKKQSDNFVFLIDGLDQIAGLGSEYRNLIDCLLSVLKNKTIISSRPFAVIDWEKDSKIKFLRLQSFSEADLETYFSNKYAHAQKICMTCPDMLRIPMLAYMVRTLIMYGNHKSIKHRTDIYRAFVDYIFKEYPHQNLRLSEERIFNIRRAYGEIAFKAITHGNPYLQKIPIEFAIDCKEIKVEIDDLFKYGIARTIVNRSGGIESFLYFSHQTFQEYLAAEYASISEDRIRQVLSEKWNPKWKEVIEFLTGFKGQMIIEKILSEKDNLIHSKLFLSARLTDETLASHELRKHIYIKLERLCEHPTFGAKAQHYMASLDLRTLVNNHLKRLKDENSDNRLSTIYFLARLKDQIGKDVINRIADRLDDEVKEVRIAAIQALSDFGDKLDDEIINKTVGLFNDKDTNIQIAAIHAVGELEVKHDKDILDKIMDRLGDEVKEVRIAAIQALSDFGDKRCDEIINKIVGLFDDKDSDVQVEAINVLGKLGDKLSDDIVNTILSRLNDIDYRIRSAAIYSLSKLKNRINKDIINKIAELLIDNQSAVFFAVLHALMKHKNILADDKHKKIIDLIDGGDSDVRVRAIYALGETGDKLSPEVLTKVADLINDKDINVRAAAIQAIGTIGRISGNDIIENITVLLDNKDINIQAAAIRTLSEICDVVDDDILKKFIDWLDDKNYKIKAAAMYALSMQENRVDNNILNKFMNLLRDRNCEVRSEAKLALFKLKDKLDEDVLNKLAKCLGNKNNDIRSAALFVCCGLQDNANNVIIDKIADLLDDKDSHIRDSAILALYSLQNKIDIESAKKIAKFNTKDIYLLLCFLYSTNRLPVE